MWSTALSDAALREQFPVPIEIKTVATAKRLRLRYDDASGSLKLTCPPRSSRRSVLAWALGQRDWIDQQIARARPPEPFEPGATIPVDGVPTKLVWSAGEPRTALLKGGELRCGGPEAGFERRIETFLKRRAQQVMADDVAEYCATAGVRARAVTIGDAATRWGSCSSDGRIRLSWRLILASPAVRRYVVAHEVAHLVHLNHGPAFKMLEARLFGPGLSSAKAELRREGARLRRIGRRR